MRRESTLTYSCAQPSPYLALVQTKKGLSRATQVATSAAKAILQPWLERLICRQLVACEPSTTPRNKLGFRCTHAWGTGVARVCRHAGAVPVSVPTAVDGDGSNLVRVMRHVGLFPAHQQQPGADDGALIPPSAVVHVTQSGSAMYGLATPTSDECAFKLVYLSCVQNLGFFVSIIGLGCLTCEALSLCKRIIQLCVRIAQFALVAKQFKSFSNTWLGSMVLR